jgi:hypothetical protein
MGSSYPALVIGNRDLYFMDVESETKQGIVSGPTWQSWYQESGLLTPHPVSVLPATWSSERKIKILSLNLTNTSEQSY